MTAAAAQVTLAPDASQMRPSIQRLPPLVFFLLLGACRGTTVEVAFTASPSFTPSRLELEVRDGAEPAVTTVFLADAGLALPVSLRLLADGPSVRLSATAIDPFAEPRQATTLIEGLKPGGAARATLDLSQVQSCPAPPPDSAAGAEVGYGEELAAGWTSFGYVGGPLQPSAGERCSGSQALQYTSVNPDNDGLGFNFPARSVSAVSMRVHVTSALVATLRVGPNTTNTIGQVTVPCDTCAFALSPGWQRVAALVPRGSDPIRYVILNVENPQKVFTVLVDDVRVVRR